MFLFFESFLFWILFAKYKNLGVKGMMEGDSRFRYEGEKGPKNWPELFEGCNGNRQSPISLHKASSTPSNFEPLQFIDYDVPGSRSKLINNGHSAQVFIEQPGGEVPTIRGGGLKADYKLMQYHFHWGKKSSKGSEHRISRKRYPIEMHLVHYNTMYGDISAAMKESDGIAVVAVLFKKESEDNPNLEPLIKGLSEVTKHGDHVYLEETMHVLDIVPNDKGSFYRYSGSLTTPDCNEVVIWTVFNTFVPISENQLNAFRSLEGFRDEGDDEDEVEHIENNFRPLQKRNHRIVLINRDSSLRTKCGFPYFCFWEDNKLKSRKISKYFDNKIPKYFWI